jgi:hypothetical protein
METAKKVRVSNEQLLAAIMAQTTAITNLVGVLTPKAATVTPAIEKEPVKFAQAVPMATEGRLIGHLPEATEIPKGIKVDWLGMLEAKARNWAIAKQVTEPVFVYFVRNSFGQHKPLFGRASSKVSANATSIYKRVN